MISFIFESIKFSVKKSVMYRGNLISWFLADIALYAGNFLAYIFMSNKIEVFGDYSKLEVLFYISCFSLVNNLFAIIYAEGIGRYGDYVINGKFDYDLLKPKGVINFLTIRNFNFPALLSTPFLIGLNLYFMKRCGVELTWVAPTVIICGCISMGMIFLIVESLTLFGIRAEALTQILHQFLITAEKPDTVFPRKVRGFLIYIIPAFLFSALPARIILGKSTLIEGIWCFSAPVIYYVLLKIIMKRGLLKYQSGAQ